MFSFCGREKGKANYWMKWEEEIYCRTFQTNHSLQLHQNLANLILFCQFQHQQQLTKIAVGQWDVRHRRIIGPSKMREWLRRIEKKKETIVFLKFISVVVASLVTAQESEKESSGFPFATFAKIHSSSFLSPLKKSIWQFSIKPWDDSFELSLTEVILVMMMTFTEWSDHEKQWEHFSYPLQLLVVASNCSSL